MSSIAPASHLRLSITFGVILHIAVVLAIWPMPRSITIGSESLKLSLNFAIDLKVKGAPSDLLDAISRTESRLRTDRFERLVVGRGASDAVAVDHADILDSLIVSLAHDSVINSIATEATRDIDFRSERYVLSVSKSSAELTANSTLGLFRGLSTFEQLWFDFNGTKYTLEAPIHIADEPAFVSNGCSASSQSVYYLLQSI